MVRDQDGRPKVVYHGTNSNFDAFDRVDSGNMWGPGHYFAENHKDASDYATGFHNRSTPQGNAGANVMPVYLNMKKPFFMDSKIDGATAKKIGKIIGQPDLHKNFDHRNTNADLRQHLHFNADSIHGSANDILRKAGFDGIVGKSPISSTTGGRTYMTFSPEQSKSAIGNSGKFSKKLPKLTESIKSFSEFIVETFDEEHPVKQFANKLKQEHPELKALHLYPREDNTIRLETIAVHKEHQGKGIGSNVMKKIVAYAKEHKQRVTLTAGTRDKDFGTTSQTRLDKFYRGHGFVANKGKNKDFAITATHYLDAR